MATPNNPYEERPGEEQEKQRSTAEQFTAPVLTVLHQVWLAGLGAATVVGQETAKAVEQLVQKGREVEPQVLEKGRQMGQDIDNAAREAGERLKDVAARINKRAEAAEAMLDERVRMALERMGYASRDDVQKLSDKLDQLTQKLEDLATKRGGRKPAEAE